MFNEIKSLHACFQVMQTFKNSPVEHEKNVPGTGGRSDTGLARKGKDKDFFPMLLTLTCFCHPIWTI